ncbi:MAG TPA: hypothetical protein VD704_05360 [Gaiellaceae bacterium]|nr:hypothetical protein [Gaiellaceae bacterium]
MTGAGHRPAWLLSLGLVAAGGLAAHGIAYRIAEPHHHEREALLEETGHGYLDPALFGSLIVALVVVGFAGRVLAGARRRAGPPLWLFALAPPLGFAVQEHAERMVHHEALFHHAAVEPAFLVGLALQVPFALAALLAARALLAVADVLAAGLGLPPRMSFPADASLALPGASTVPPSPVLVGARGQRAPPAPRQA